MSTKTCATCKEAKPLTSFYKHQSNKDKLRFDCKACDNQRSKLWNTNHKEQTKAYMLAWREANKETLREKARLNKQQVKSTVFEHYGNSCSCCGLSNPKFLTLDHINNDGALQRKHVAGGYHFYNWAIKQQFPTDLRLLCWNCNCGRHHNGGVCPHKDLPQEDFSSSSWEV